MKKLKDIITEKLHLGNNDIPKETDILMDIDNKCEFTSDEIDSVKKFIDSLNTKKTPYTITNKFFNRHNKIEPDYDLYVYYDFDWDEHELANDDISNGNAIYFWRETRANHSKVGYNAVVFVKGKTGDGYPCYDPIDESPSTNINETFTRIEKILKKLDF